MALVSGAIERIFDGGGDALGRVTGDAQGLRDLVGSLEADAKDVLREPEGVFLDGFDGAVTVLFVDFCGEVGADPAALEEDHHLLDRFLFEPGGFDHRDSFAADSAHFGQALGMVVDDVQCFGTEMGDDAFGRHRTDAFDQAAAKVFLDAGHGRGKDRTQADDGELFAILGVQVPVSVELDGFAYVNTDHRAHDRCLFLPVRQVTGRLFQRQFGDCIAVFFIVEGDALDDAAQQILHFAAHGC